LKSNIGFALAVLNVVCIGAEGLGAPAFRNLEFEQPTQVPSEPYGQDIPIGDLMPVWRAYFGEHPNEVVQFNDHA
jgi:hypothetical protein